MFDYLTDPRNMLPTNRKDQTSIRGNIAKEISRPQMTWKVFCKGLRILQVAEFELKITIKRRNGEVSEHGTFVKLGTTAAEEEIIAIPSELAPPIEGRVIPTEEAKNKRIKELHHATQTLYTGPTESRRAEGEAERLDPKFLI